MQTSLNEHHFCVCCGAIDAVRHKQQEQTDSYECTACTYRWSLPIREISVDAPQEWAKVVKILTTKTYDCLWCADGSFATTDIGAVSLGQLVRVHRRRLEIMPS